ncbi:MAG: LLM class flavin-dependent oxidoreductase [Chloroflexi bacterium]|nr:LLM class flavin-dependent oxidoreductase [Chloroflexota bacterium]
MLIGPPEAPRIGVVLPTRGILLQGPDPVPAAHVLDVAQRAEDIGVDSLWVGDSLIAKPRLEPLATLAAVAARTSRVRIGTAVLLGALRHPLLLAQTAATVDLLSQGRLVLAMGAGGAFTPGQQQEWHSAGIDRSTRGRRLAEIIEIAQRLWQGETVTFQGRFFSLDRVALGFRPHQRPRIPVLLACHSGPGLERQYRRAARLADGMISITDSPAEFAGVRKAVLQEVQAAGRDPLAFRAAYYMTVNLDHDPDAAASEGDAWVKAYYGLNWWGDRWGPYGRAESVVARIREYTAAGADEVILRFASYDQPRQLDLLASEVLPALR